MANDYTGTWESENGKIRFRLEHKIETIENNTLIITTDILYMNFEKFEYNNQDLREYWQDSMRFWPSPRYWFSRDQNPDRDQWYEWKIWIFSLESHKSELEITYNPINALHPDNQDPIHRLKFKVKKVE